MANLAAAMNLEGIYSELHSGSAYKEFVQNVPDLVHTIVVVLIISGDGTVIDGVLQKSLETFSVTLGIFH